MGISPQGEKMQKHYSVVKLAVEVSETWGELSVKHVRRFLKSKDTQTRQRHEREAVRCAVEAAHHAIRAQIYRERGL
jgi:hypothetical protein